MNLLLAEAIGDQFENFLSIGQAEAAIEIGRQLDDLVRLPLFPGLFDGSKLASRAFLFDLAHPLFRGNAEAEEGGVPGFGENRNAVRHFLNLDAGPGAG